MEDVNAFKTSVNKMNYIFYFSRTSRGTHGCVSKCYTGITNNMKQVSKNVGSKW